MLQVGVGSSRLLVSPVFAPSPAACGELNYNDQDCLSKARYFQAITITVSRLSLSLLSRDGGSIVAKKADIARELITPKLEAGEQLCSVSSSRSGPFWAMMLLSNLFAFAIKYYYMGVTDKRLIFVRINGWGKPMDEGSAAVPLTDVIKKGNALVVKLPDKEKPQKFEMDFGLSKLTGYNKEEFIAALHTE